MVEYIFMSYEVETRNRGAVGEFGYLWGDTSRIGLGDLPFIPSHQFATYASETVIAAYIAAPEDRKIRMRNSLSWAIDSAEEIHIREENPLKNPRFLIIESEQVGEVEGIPIYQSPETGTFAEEFVNEQDPERKQQMAQEFVMAWTNSVYGKTIDYSENPFRLEADTVVIGETYVLNDTEFTTFTAYVLAGGLRGWTKDSGIPAPSYNAIRRLAEVIKG